jgi:hypothetical protein
VGSNTSSIQAHSSQCTLCRSRLAGLHGASGVTGVGGDARQGGAEEDRGRGREPFSPTPVRLSGLELDGASTPWKKAWCLGWSCVPSCTRAAETVGDVVEEADIKRVSVLRTAEETTPAL